MSGFYIQYIGLQLTFLMDLHFGDVSILILHIWKKILLVWFEQTLLSYLSIFSVFTLKINFEFQKIMASIRPIWPIWPIWHSIFCNFLLQFYFFIVGYVICVRYVRWRPTYRLHSLPAGLWTLQSTALHPISPAVFLVSYALFHAHCVLTFARLFLLT